MASELLEGRPDWALGAMLAISASKRFRGKERLCLSRFVKMSPARRFKQFIKARWHSMFVMGQRFGFDLLPRHFYSEVPDIRALRGSASWRRPFSMQGVAGVDLEDQLKWLQQTVTPAAQTYLEKNAVHRLACEDNGENGYGQVEAGVLHSFIFTHKPKLIIQVGCGVSTAICLRAAAVASYRPRIICIEPYAHSYLRRAADREDIELMDKKLQDTDPQLLGELGEGDLFFVDSSHSLGPAGEVTRIILEYLPRLRPGVHIHFHDIFFPYDYALDTLDTALFFCHETALLLAFLTLNGDFRVSCCMSMLHHQKAVEVQKLLPSYQPCRVEDGLAITPGDFPSALYLRRVAKTLTG